MAVIHQILSPNENKVRLLIYQLNIHGVNERIATLLDCNRMTQSNMVVNVRKSQLLSLCEFYVNGLVGRYKTFSGLKWSVSLQCSYLKYKRGYCLLEYGDLWWSWLHWYFKSYWYLSICIPILKVGYSFRSVLACVLLSLTRCWDADISSSHFFWPLL